MKRNLSFALIGALFLGVLYSQIASSSAAKGDSRAPYETEYRFAISAILKNVLGDGAVVASPSRVMPNYQYEWIRDSSLTIRALGALNDPSINKTIDLWVSRQIKLQNMNGAEGLGEPRFNLDGTVNTEPWSRPQNDGPALRALAVIQIAKRWIREGRQSEVESHLYRAEMPATTLIKRDLEYVATHWQFKSFDLWEEQKAMHFYTMVVQRAALAQGAEFADLMKDGFAAKYYRDQVSQLDVYLGNFTDPSSGIIRYALNKDPSGLDQTKTTDLDISVLLAALHSYDGAFHLSLSSLQLTISALTAAFNQEYPLNRTSNPSLGVALGRYPGDVYDGSGFSGGNPWFLATLALAEFDCLRTGGLTNTAKAQFDRVLFHKNGDGALSEQFNHTTGFEQGARDLTWSYVSYVTAYRACFKGTR